MLAGSNLLLARGTVPLVDRVGPAVETLVVLAWATATFWFPLMIAIGVWRHLEGPVRGVVAQGHPPHGMYGVATSRMIGAIGLTTLDWLPPVVLAIAVLGRAGLRAAR